MDGITECTGDMKMICEYIQVAYFHILVHARDIQMTHGYIRLTYEWIHTFEYIRITWMYIRVAYEWHTSDIWVHTNGIQMTYELKY